MSATLSGLLAAEGLQDAGERLKWLLITWDLACDAGRANKYARFFLTDDSFLVTRGQRSERAFGDEKPLRGTLDSYRFHSVSSLEQAITATTTKLAGDYSMLCRPLTVDCSDWDGERTSGGEEIRDASHLLHELFNKTPTGLRLLSDINNTRSLACSTRIDPDWETNFSAVTQRGLWDGL